MRAAGKLAAEVLNFAGTLVRPGITTDEIDVAVHAMTVAAGAYPSPLNYGGFPKSVCTSLNECICHGIPDSTVLQEGDIINIDVTVFLDGHHGDTSRTFHVGAVDAGAAALVDATQRALFGAIALCAPGVPFRNIGTYIHALADKEGYGVVPAFVGHGVGREFHSGPTIVHCRNTEPGVMAVGQTFTIEPMLTLGGTKERFWPDEWTAVTADGSWSAQFEHTLLIVPGGVEVMTLAEGTPAVVGLPSDEARAARAAAAPAPAAGKKGGGGAKSSSKGFGKK
jgi:methionyl aminopeptidase